MMPPALMIKVFAEKAKRSRTNESAFKFASYEGRLACMTRRLLRFHHARESGQLTDELVSLSSTFLDGVQARKYAAQQRRPMERMIFCTAFIFRNVSNYAIIPLKIFDTR